MSKKYVQPGAVLPITLGGTTAADAVVAIGDVFGIALSGGGDGDVVQAQIQGVFEVPKVAPLVIGQGAQLYWNGTAATTDADGGDNDPIGIAAAGGESAATTINCALNVLSGAKVLELANAYTDAETAG